MQRLLGRQRKRSFVRVVGNGDGGVETTKRGKEEEEDGYQLKQRCRLSDLSSFSSFFRRSKRSGTLSLDLRF